GGGGAPPLRPQLKPQSVIRHIWPSMTTATDLWSLAGAILLSLGGGGAIVIVLSSWLGKVWATRIAESEKARFAKDLEGYKSELQALADERREGLARKRDVYGKLIASMRVFQAGSRPANADEQREFLLAFDQAALWASEPVTQALGEFVDAVVHNTQQRGSVSNDELTRRYAECVNAMRRDSGFPETTFIYRVITF
ncbi:MAG TPA: hypothetical protein PKC18_18025, partial [Lacipirellulaceae bacterium]|nr:hypothetical protein [Lacipirellulaceae bacterium]